MEILTDLYRTIVEVVDMRVGEIKVTRSDFEDLKSVVKELADAQARTERRVEELAQAEARTVKEPRNVAKQVGGLNEKLGGSLEDLSYDVLPACLEKYYQVEVDELGRD